MAFSGMSESDEEFDEVYESGKRVVPPATMKKIRAHANKMGQLKKQVQKKTPESEIDALQYAIDRM